MENKKERVAISSVLAGFLLTILKLVVGILTGSIGIISEAAHSALDLLAALITYFAVRISKKPADETHHFGHGKIENISALTETLLLFLTCGWIIYEAIHRLMTGKSEIEIAWYSFAVMIISIVVDISRSRALNKVAKETKSQALEADALHFSSDIYSSAVVIAGLIFTYFGIKGADAFSAIGVALLVLFVSYGLGRRTINILIDTVPTGISEEIKAIILKIDGVIKVERLRIRPNGSSYFIHAMISVSRKIPLERTSVIIKEIKKQIETIHPDADIVINIKPVALKDETLVEQIQIIAANHDADVHDITIQNLNDKTFINFHLEVNGSLNLKKAHAKANEIEKSIKEELGENLNIVIHVEPAAVISTKGIELDQQTISKINQLLEDVCSQVKEVKGISDLSGRNVGGQIFLSLSCIMNGKISLEKSHDISDKIEEILKKNIPNLQRAVIHLEPKGK